MPTSQRDAETPPLIALTGINLAVEGKTILTNLDWRLRTGEHWLVTGANGAGKSLFLKLLKGEIWPAPGFGRRVYAFDGRPTESPIDALREVRIVSPHQRDHYLRNELNFTGERVILGGVHDTDYFYAKLGEEDHRRVERLIRRMGLERIARKSIQFMSRGELGKILIARALAAQPRVLALDEIEDGLDVKSQAMLFRFLETIASSDTTLVYASHRVTKIPAWFTHHLHFGEGRILSQETISHVPLDPRLHRATTPTRKAAQPAAEGKPIVSVRGADVFLERKKVLRQIDWEIRSGEHWLVTGGNGSGKSTLLKLLAGDLHPAFGSEVIWLGRKKVRTLWAVRRNVALYSPDAIHAWQDDWKCLRVVASGFYASDEGPARVTPAVKGRAMRLLAMLGVEKLANRGFLSLSFGEAKKVLLARALINAPRLLLLDEPFNGLDRRAKKHVLERLHRLAKAGTTTVIVTHYHEDYPDFLTHRLKLEKGRVAERIALS